PGFTRNKATSTTSTAPATAARIVLRLLLLLTDMTRLPWLGLGWESRRAGVGSGRSLRRGQHCALDRQPRRGCKRIGGGEGEPGVAKGPVDLSSGERRELGRTAVRGAVAV